MKIFCLNVRRDADYLYKLKKQHTLRYLNKYSVVSEVKFTENLFSLKY